MITGPASFRFIPRRAWNSLIVKHIGNTLFAMAFQGPLENLADYFGCFGVDDDVVFVRGVLLVTVDGKSTDVLALTALQVENHADVLGEILQVPLIDQAIDLTGFFVTLDLCVGIIGHRDEANPPNRKQAVDILLYQFHIPSKPGLAFTEDDLELFLLCRCQHPIEVRAKAVGSGIVLVAVDGVDVPAVVDGVVGQQGFLILDALGFRLVLVFVLLTQAYIDCTENLLHLLEGVTAHV